MPNRTCTCSNSTIIPITYPHFIPRQSLWDNKIPPNPRNPNQSRMAMRNFYNQIKGKKVTEIPELVKPMLSLSNIKSTVKKGLDNYHAKYIETSSVDPLLHVCFGGMAFSYLVALPEERRHLEHAQHAKEHGGH
ncbi:hypothetical protein Leryth_012626 [Lithospermum erythrorhizon]|nr:hypothetical protein Leryth_012626 [Lithospermum erythrorhizon]